MIRTVRAPFIQTHIDRGARCVHVEMRIENVIASARFDLEGFTELLRGLMADHESLRQLVEQEP